MNSTTSLVRRGASFPWSGLTGWAKGICLLAWLAGAAIGMAFLAEGRAENADVRLEAGVAVRDITPEGGIWLAGYAGRNKPSSGADGKLLAQAVALRDGVGERIVFIALDNCEVSHAFARPVAEELQTKHKLKRGAVMIVSSHTHSAPVLDKTLISMYKLSEQDKEQIRLYSERLVAQMLELVQSALNDLQPAQLEYGVGEARFAMNRRVYRDSGIAFGDNPDGPVDWDVPVLRVKGTNNTVRAVLFGYACHGTSIRTGDDFYRVSGDYMAYARDQIEAVYPGLSALYLTGMGADADPSPRGGLLEAKKHGLELAGAVVGVLGRPMRPVRGPLRLAYEEVQLPLETPPSREQLAKDAASDDYHVKTRAQVYLAKMDKGEPLPNSISLPLAAIRLGKDLTFLAVGGEVVVDYAKRFKRLFADDHPWTIGYAYEVPCYIPSIRIIKEGGYEAQSSLIYYGLYGPFHGRTELLLVEKMGELVKRTRGEGERSKTVRQ